MIFKIQDCRVSVQFHYERWLLKKSIVNRTNLSPGPSGQKLSLCVHMGQFDRLAIQLYTWLFPLNILPSHKPLLVFLPASLPRIPALLQHQILYFRLQRRLDDVIVVAMRRELHALHCGNHQSQSVQKCAADPCSKDQGMVAIPVRNETWRLYFFVPGTRQNYTM